MARRIPHRWLLLGLLLVLARHVWVSAYVHPYLDDFAYAVAGQRSALLDRWLHEYQHWNGRWVSNLLVLRGPLAGGLEQGLALYRLVPVLLMLLTATGAMLLVRSFMDRSTSSGVPWLAALLFLAVYLHLMPHAGEGFYWYTGAISYQLPSALLLVHAAVLLSQWRQGPSVKGTLLMVLLMAWMAGSTEVHMVLLVLLQAGVLVLRKRAVGHVEAVWWVMFGWAVALALVMILAPGNAVRGAMFPARHDVLLTLSHAVLQTARFTLLWVVSPALLLVSWLFLRHRWHQRAEGSLASALGVGPWVALVLPFLVVFITMLLPYWSTGMLGQHRTVNVALLAFLPLWFVALAVWEERVLRPRGWSARWLDGPATPWPWVALGICLLVMRHDGTVSRELLDCTLHRYDRHVQERYGLLREAIAKGATALDVPAVPVPPRTLGILEPGNDPAGHWNRSMVAYFGADELQLRVVRTTVPTVTSPHERE